MVQSRFPAFGLFWASRRDLASTNSDTTDCSKVSVMIPSIIDQIIDCGGQPDSLVGQVDSTEPPHDRSHICYKRVVDVSNRHWDLPAGVVESWSRGVVESWSRVEA